MIIKRRTLLYMIAVVVVGLCTFYVYEKEIVELAGPDSVFFNGNAQFHGAPDPSITWNGFVSDFSTRSTSNSVTRTKFDNNFKNKVIKWEGTVLRVDSFDEDVELLNGLSPGKAPDLKSDKDSVKALNIHSTDT